MSYSQRSLQLRWISISVVLGWLFFPSLLPLANQQAIFGNPAAAQSTPQPASGNVYVLSHGEWREAFIQLATGRISQGRPAWIYTVQYLDGNREVENGVTADRVRPLEEFLTTVTADSSPGASTPVYDVSSEAGIEQMLAAHNQQRQAVGVSDLRWSAALATQAQNWAETLIAERRLAHSPDRLRDNGNIGENITSRRHSGGAYSTPAQAVAGWVAERHDYDYAANRCTSGRHCGHYTQIVWANTTEVGCGVARTSEGFQEIWVCHYNPGGNFVGQRPY